MAGEPPPRPADAFIPAGRIFFPEALAVAVIGLAARMISAGCMAATLTGLAARGPMVALAREAVSPAAERAADGEYS